MLLLHGGVCNIIIAIYRISFVGGKNLSSTPSGDYQVGDIRVYPPPTSMPTVTVAASVSTGGAKASPAPPSTTPAVVAEEEKEPEPVGK